MTKFIKRLSLVVLIFFLPCNILNAGVTKGKISSILIDNQEYCLVKDQNSNIGIVEIYLEDTSDFFTIILTQESEDYYRNLTMLRWLCSAFNSNGIVILNHDEFQIVNSIRVTR